VIGQAKNRLCKTGKNLADKRPTLASIATPGHCRDWASIANGSHLFLPEDKDKLDFSEPAMLFYAQESTT